MKGFTLVLAAMGQTITVLPRLKRIYRDLIQNPTLDRAVHATLDASVSAYSRAAGFTFPKKFNWDWKWEMLAELYEKETVALCRRLIQPGMHVLDIGAHAGYFTRLYSKLVGPDGIVLAFEPDPENFALLAQNTRRLKNVRLFPVAISDRVGTLDFFESENNTGCHSLIPTGFRPNKISVTATTLDALMDAGELPKVDLIKMDIEGAEPIALEGMRRVVEANPEIVLIVEFCPNFLRDGHFDPGVFVETLRALGFRVFAIKDEELKEITLVHSRNGHFFLKNNYVNLFLSHKSI